MATKHRKPKGDRKDDGVRVRLNMKEKADFTKAAKREGLGLSAWLRMLATRAAGEPNK